MTVTFWPEISITTIIEKPTEAHLNPCDVLVVEDEFALSEAMRHLLTSSGLRVRQAHNRSEALSVAAMAPPRIAILDYQLPDTDGLSLATELRTRFPALHVILMSANKVDVDQSALDRVGIKAFVNKPLPPAALRDAILRLIQT